MGPVSCVTLRRNTVITGSWDGAVCVASLAAYREKWTEEHAVAMLARANRRLSKEARSVAGDLAERAQEKRKSVRRPREYKTRN